MSNTIKVNVHHPTSGEVSQVYTPVNIRGYEFIDELVLVLNLPLTHEEGWGLVDKSTGIVCRGEKTLEENGVSDGSELSLFPNTAAGGFLEYFQEKLDAKKIVFVIYGRNSKARRALFQFLRSIGLHPLEWGEVVEKTGKTSPYVGEILDKAFSIAQAAIILLTPDDEARLSEKYRGNKEPDYEVQLTGQARPNVIFEAGMAMGMYPDRTVLIELGELRPISDIGGRHVIRLNNTVARRQELAQRLKTAGCAINLSGTDWHEEGNFLVESFSPKQVTLVNSNSNENDNANFTRINSIIYALENFNSNPEAIFYIGQTILECESFLEEVNLLNPVEDIISSVIDEIDNDARRNEGLFDPIISINKVRKIIKYLKRIRLDLSN